MNSTQVLAELATGLATGSIEVVDLRVTLSPETPAIRLRWSNSRNRSVMPAM